MKTIYINLDPYLAAFAAWLNGGKVGPAPSGPSIPLSVTVPLGDGVAIYLNGFNEDGSPASEYFTVDGQYIGVFEEIGAGDSIAENLTPALSSLIPGAHYYVRAVTSDVSVLVTLSDEDGNEYPFTIPVLVRREQAQGPADLVDFTPPAAAPSAADIKSALVAAGPGALEGVSLDGMDLSESAKITCHESSSEYPIGYYRPAQGSTITEIIGYASES